MLTKVALHAFGQRGLQVRMRHEPDAAFASATLESRTAAYAAVPHDGDARDA